MCRNETLNYIGFPLHPFGLSPPYLQMASRPLSLASDPLFKGQVWFARRSRT